MLSEIEHVRYWEEILKKHISDVLTNMNTNIELFEILPCSYPSHLRAVKNADGRHPNYSLSFKKQKLYVIVIILNQI